MTVHQFRSGPGDSAAAHRPDDTLIQRLRNGDPYAISFGGQGVAWLPALAELVVDAELDRSVAQIVDAAERLLPRWPMISSPRDRTASTH